MAHLLGRLIDFLIANDEIVKDQGKPANNRDFVYAQIILELFGVNYVFFYIVFEFTQYLQNISETTKFLEIHIINKVFNHRIYICYVLLFLL
jgi:hypothetical protein